MYDSIALGGGGARGFVHVGALRALQEVKGNLEFPRGIYGQSIGAIVAVAVAFRIPVDTIEAIARKKLFLSTAFPELRIEHVTQFLDTKGFFSMDLFEQILCEVYDLAGIDIRTKRVRDAPQPLYIVASNVTTGKSCLLTGDVPILKALRCSACIPFLFRPEVLYGQMYVDGAIYSRSIRQVVPPGTLILQLTVGEYNPTDFGSYVYALTSGPSHQYTGDTMIVFRNIAASMGADPTEDDITTMIAEGYSQARTWLAERIPEKSEQT